jgi:hypothetical protein
MGIKRLLLLSLRLEAVYHDVPALLFAYCDIIL